MNDADDDRDEVERLAEEFLERRRRGERPTVSEYEQCFPHLAQDIRELFPAMAFVDDMADASNGKSPTPTPIQVIGEYRVLRELGRGGMGVVYEAVQASLGRHVALKVLPLAAVNNVSYVERFHREARAAGQLHHTNIVPVFGVGVADGLHYYAMQYIQGHSLDAVLRTLRRQRGQAKTQPHVDATADAVLPTSDGDASASSGFTATTDAEYFRRIARIGAQVADALAYAHDQGVLHRDIKPGNLLLDSRETVWVTDFGLAKTADEAGLTHTGDFVGTVRYMAPERFRGPGDARSDVYSLGVTLYELLTLRPAFADTDRPQLMEQVLHAEPPPPRQLERKIPRDLETIVLMAMAKEPRHRYPSAAALADDLRRFLADRPILARRTPPVERVWRWCRRNPRLSATAGVAAAALLVILIGSPLMTLELLSQRRQTRQELWVAQLARAEAARSSPQAGRRFDGLRALDDARLLLSSLDSTAARTLDLRNRMIASLSLADLGLDREWDGYPPGSAGVCFDSSLERYARSDARGDISVRRVSDDSAIAQLPGEGHGAWTLHFSPDGRHLAAGYQQRYQRDALRFCIWNVEQRTPVVRSSTTAGCGEVDFSPDGRRATYMKGVGQIAIRDLSTDTEQILPLPDLPKHVAFHPAGDRIAVTLDRFVEVRSLDPWQALDRWEHASEVNALGWRRDGRLLATAAGSHIYLWEPGKKELVAQLRGHEGQVIEVAFNSAGDRLASKAHDGSFRFWDVDLRRTLVHTTSVFTGCSRLRFSPDDKLLGFTSDGAKLRLWRVARGDECRTLIVRQPADWQTLAGRFSPDGRLLAAAGSDGARIWDWASGRLVAHAQTPACFSALFTGDGRTLVTSGNHGLERWPVNTDGTLGEPTPVGPSRPLRYADLSADGGKLLATAERGLAIVLDLASPVRSVDLAGHRQSDYVALNRDGTLAATGPWYGDSAGVRVWNTATGAILRELPADASATVAFSPAGDRLAVGTETAFTVVDTSTWQTCWRITKAPEIRPGQVSYSADGRLLAVRHAPTRLHLLDPADGRLLADLQTPGPHTISWHALSRDASALAAGCVNSTVYVWDLKLIRRQLAERNLDW